jgi:hypothetical protein
MNAAMCASYLPERVKTRSPFPALHFSPAAHLHSQNQRTHRQEAAKADASKIAGGHESAAFALPVQWARIPFPVVSLAWKRKVISL